MFFNFIPQNILKHCTSTTKNASCPVDTTIISPTTSILCLTSLILLSPSLLIHIVCIYITIEAFGLEYMRLFRWWWMVIWFFWFGRVVCKLCVILIFYVLQCIKTFLNSHKFLCGWYFEGGIGEKVFIPVRGWFWICKNPLFMHSRCLCADFFAPHSHCGTSIVCILKKSEKWNSNYFMQYLYSFCPPPFVKILFYFIRFFYTTFLYFSTMPRLFLVWNIYDAGFTIWHTDMARLSLHRVISLK